MKQIFAVLLLLLISSTSFSAVHFVPDDMPSLTEGLDQVSAGDTIIYREGEYVETASIYDISLVLASEYLLTGDSTAIANTFINDHHTYSASPIRFFNSLEDTIRVIGLSFVESDAAYKGGAIFADSCLIEIRDCVFRNCFARIGGAIFTDECFTVLRFNVFEENGAVNSGGAVTCADGSGIIRENHFIANHLSGSAAALRLDGAVGDSWRVYSNTFAGNQAPSCAGMSVFGCSQAIIRNNVFRQNRVHDPGGYGYAGVIYVGDSLDSLLIENNEFLQNVCEGIAASITTGSSGHILDNRFIGNTSNNGPAIYASVANGYVPEYLFIEGNLFLANRSFTEPSPDLVYGVINNYTTCSMTVFENDFYDNAWRSIDHFLPSGNGATILENNYWGDPSGPYHLLQHPEGEGDTLSTVVPVGEWSETPNLVYRRPRSFDLLEPGDGTILDPDNITFRWQQSVDPEEDDYTVYRLQIDDAAHWDDPAFDIDTETDTTWTVEHLEPERPWQWRVVAYDTLGIRRFSGQTWDLWVVGVDERDGSTLPDRFAITSAWPNPFNASVQVRVALPRAADLTVRIHDIEGRLVADLSRNAVPAGYQTFTWNGSGHSSGLYFVSLQAEMVRDTRKIVLVK